MDNHFVWLNMKKEKISSSHELFKKNFQVKDVAQVEEIGRMNELHEQMTLDYRNGHVCDAWKEFSNILDFRLAYADLLRD